MKQHVLTIIGSRPEAIKMAPIVMAMRKQPDEFHVTVCSTGQQRNMIPQALEEFGLAPDVDLNVMSDDQTLAELTSRLLTSLDSTICDIQPHWILVQGDTTSAMVGAVAGFYRRISVAHVEAGMRTGDPYSPFPEEVNRRIITQCATLHFAPTNRCRDNLLKEGVPETKVFVTGNTVIDALLYIREEIRGRGSQLPSQLLEQLNGHRMILVTSHRRESFGPGLEGICLALRELHEEHQDVVFVYPVHPNPNVREPVQRLLGDRERILLIEPQPYKAMVELMDRSYVILTDSGGLQEEAPSLGKPVLVLRDKTERPEGVEAGNAELVGTDKERIVRVATELLTNRDRYRLMSSPANPYGDGKAAERMVAILEAGVRELEVKEPQCVFS